MGYWKFWKIHYRPPTWSRGRKFQLHWEPDIISGMLYAGVTVFGHSVLYSDHW